CSSDLYVAWFLKKTVNFLLPNSSAFLPASLSLPSSCTSARTEHLSSSSASLSANRPTTGTAAPLPLETLFRSGPSQLVSSLSGRTHLQSCFFPADLPASAVLGKSAFQASVPGLRHCIPPVRPPSLPDPI